MTIVPTEIRPHLIPYFFKEFEGKEALYMGKKVHAVKISTSSSLGHWMRLFMIKVDKPDRADHYNLYLTVDDSPAGNKKYEGNFYRYESGARSFLTMPVDVSKALNDLLEDIFRTNFVSYVDGYLEARGTGKVNDRGRIEAINKFIDKYDLLEVGQNTESMRQLYYREKDRGRLERFQSKAANTHKWKK